MLFRNDFIDLVLVIVDAIGIIAGIILCERWGFRLGFWVFGDGFRDLVEMDAFNKR